MQAHQQQHPIVYFLFLLFIGCINTPLRAMKKKEIGVGRFCPHVTTLNEQKQKIDVAKFCRNIKTFEIFQTESLNKKQEETIFFFTEKQNEIGCETTDEIIETFKAEEAYYEKGIYDCLATEKTLNDSPKPAALLFTFQNDETKELSSLAIQSFDPKNPLYEIFLYTLLKHHNNGLHNNVIAYVPKKKASATTIKDLKQLNFTETQSKRNNYSVLNLSKQQHQKLRTMALTVQNRLKK